MPDFLRKVIWMSTRIFIFFSFLRYLQITLLCVCLCVKCLVETSHPELRVWSSSVPYINTSTLGTTVWAEASGQLWCESQETLFFKTVRMSNLG